MAMLVSERQTTIAPHLPNELKIHILSFIDDPHFLWTTCRYVSRNFRTWSEKQYARKHLPQMRFEVHTTPRVQRKVMHRDLDYILTRSEFLFYMENLDTSDTSRAILKPRGPPFCTLSVPESRRDRRNRMLLSERTGQQNVTQDEEFEQLSELSKYDIRCQIHPETALGLRSPSQGFVCACRSLRGQVRRGTCDRYIGAEKIFDWNADERILIVRWKALLNHVHAGSCRPKMIS